MQKWGNAWCTFKPRKRTRHRTSRDDHSLFHARTNERNRNKKNIYILSVYKKNIRRKKIYIYIFCLYIYKKCTYICCSIYLHYTWRLNRRTVLHVGVREIQLYNRVWEKYFTSVFRGNVSTSTKRKVVLWNISKNVILELAPFLESSMQFLCTSASSESLHSAERKSRGRCVSDEGRTIRISLVLKWVSFEDCRNPLSKDPPDRNPLWKRLRSRCTAANVRYESRAETDRCARTNFKLVVRFRYVFRI